MESKKNAYNSTIKGYISNLNVDAAKKRQLYIALNGGIYSSLVDKKGRGTKTMYFEDGTSQRVDTYEGRFKAVSRILGEDFENSDLLYKSITEKNYSPKSKAGTLKKKMIEGYFLRENIEEKQSKKNLESSILEEPINNQNEYIQEDSTQYVSSSEKNKNLFKKIARGVATASLFAGVLFTNYSCDKNNYFNEQSNQSTSKIEVNKKPSPVRKVLELDSSMYNLLTGSSLTGSENNLESMSELAYRNIFQENGNAQEFSQESLKKESSKEDTIQTSQIQKTKEDYSISQDLKKYVDHTTARNAQIREGDISVNPVPMIKQIGNNFIPLKEEITQCSELGYAKENFSNRKENVKSGLKKLGNGLQKLVSLGFWDSRKEEEKTNEGNQVLRFLKSPYDIVLGTVQSAVNSVDYVAGGAVGKTLETTIDAARGVVGTAVSATNYVGALPFYPLDKSEEFLHQETISQNVYETVFSLARFGGNVLSHEVPENGKTIEIISNEGKKVILDKGEIGATLELITGLGLDSFAISKLVEGSGSSHSSGNGGAIPSNGGIVIVPGNGGSVGGGM